MELIAQWLLGSTLKGVRVRASSAEVVSEITKEQIGGRLVVSAQCSAKAPQDSTSGFVSEVQLDVTGHKRDAAADAAPHFRISVTVQGRYEFGGGRPPIETCSESVTLLMGRPIYLAAVQEVMRLSLGLDVGRLRLPLAVEDALTSATAVTKTTLQPAQSAPKAATKKSKVPAKRK